MFKHFNEVCRALATVAALLAWMSGAAAEDVLKLLVAHQGSWDSAVPDLGQKAGIFKKHGIVLDVSYIPNGGETEMPVLSGYADMGVGVTVLGALRAYAKGEPLRIIGASTTGSANYWYVPSASAVRVVKDINGRTIAYPTRGEESRYDVFDFMKYYRLRARPVASPGDATTLKEVLGGRIDVGWATPPFGIDAIDEGQIRSVARANEVSSIKDKTSRVIITTADRLQKSKAVLERFMQAYRETVEWMYADAQAVKRYAELAGLPETVARRVRDEFYDKDMLMPEKVTGLKTILREGSTLSYFRQPLAKAQINEVIQIVTAPSQGGWFRAFTR